MKDRKFLGFTFDQWLQRLVATLAVVMASARSAADLLWRITEPRFIDTVFVVVVFVWVSVWATAWMYERRDP